jgi:GLPGLI family protein
MTFHFLTIGLIISTSLFGLPTKHYPSNKPAAEAVSCTYRLTYQPDSATKTTQTEYMTLVTGDNLSKFQSRGAQLKDSLASANEHLPTTQAGLQLLADKMSSFPRSAFSYCIYKNTASGKVYYYDRIGTTLYLQEEPEKSLAWKLDAATTTIAGYLCQKATCSFAGRVYEAWFTRQIPIAEGPYKFYGLPGLIVKLNDSRAQYTFELVGLKKLPAAPPIALPAKVARPATMTELWKGQLAYGLSVPDRMAAMGNNITAAKKQEMQEKVRRRNNPLELK